MMSSSSNSNSRAGSERVCGSVIRPQPVTESSLMETVGSLIHEVQTYPIQSADPKIQINWARFENADINDVGFYTEGLEINGNSSPLLLILGYTAGAQVWLIPITGEAQEVLSWRQGQVKILRILSKPENAFGSPDNFSHTRPLIALSDSSGPGSPFTTASFISLKSGEQIHNIKFNSEIMDILANKRVVVISFREKFAVFNACNLEARFTVTSCFPSPGVNCNPIALGNRWLAYASQKVIPIHKSFGGMEMDGNHSVTAWGINVGSKLAQGVSKIYSNIFTNNGGVNTLKSGSLSTYNEPQKGVVMILDILEVSRGDHEEINVGDRIDGVIAHFLAHSKAIVALKFDHSGSLLLTCDRLGNIFNLFRINSHPGGSCYAAIHHLYALYRGDTPGSVQDIAFSSDSRWVAISTIRGTTHIFPITPYGGPVGVRTHTSHRVVNRLSRFHRSAGLDETSTRSSTGRTSPLLSSSPGSSNSSLEICQVLPYPNPHVPPFTTPVLIHPVAQLRQPFLLSSLQQLGVSVTGSHRKNRNSILDDIQIRLACIFAPSRAWLIGNPHNMFTRNSRTRNIDSLYIMANHGVLLEYTLDPTPNSNLPKEKLCESSPVELHIIPYGQWSLSKPRDKTELQPPLPLDNPLMLPLEQLLKGSLMLNPSLNDDDDDDDDEHWLSQVEIITHHGPHRRLWMGPQFSFQTLQSSGSQSHEEIQNLDVNSIPIHSHPVNMSERRENFHIFIEAGSASSSFELSPRFANNFNYYGSRESGSQDVENELCEAMSETIIIEDEFLDQSKISHKEEEFFCLTPEDSRSISSARSRNSSTTSLLIEKTTIESKNECEIKKTETICEKYHPLKTILKTPPLIRTALVHEEIIASCHKTEELMTPNSKDGLLVEAARSLIESSIEGPANKTQVETLKYTEDENEDDDEYLQENFYILDSESCRRDKSMKVYENQSIHLTNCKGKYYETIINKEYLCGKEPISIIKDIKAAGEKYETRGRQPHYSDTEEKWRSRPSDSSDDDYDSRKKPLYYDDSESTDEDNGCRHKSEKEEGEHEGWSFEDKDVNKLIAQVSVNELAESNSEKTSLEDVFTFDSENVCKKPLRRPPRLETERGDYKLNEENSTSCGATSGDSSLANSPNVKKYAKGRNKKKKVRR